MSAEELDDFLGEQRVCRLATISPSGPHVSPVWYVWHDGALWFYSLTRSQRWTDMLRDPRVSAVIDAGQGYQELRGVEVSGRVEPVGEVPRTGAPDERLAPVEAAFGGRYGKEPFTWDGRHAWLRLDPAKVVSWDFRKLPAG